jgi:hypothetical protein
MSSCNSDNRPYEGDTVIPSIESSVPREPEKALPAYVDDSAGGDGTRYKPGVERTGPGEAITRKSLFGGHLRKKSKSGHPSGSDSRPAPTSHYKEPNTTSTNTADNLAKGLAASTLNPSVKPPS